MTDTSPAPLSAESRQTVALRLERWAPDLEGALRLLYPDDVVQDVLVRALDAARAAFAERAPALRRLDEQRTLRPDWFQQPSMLGYAAYADRFGGTLAGVGERIPYLRELGVTYLHLMPLLRPRDGDSDGGYAVADYRAVRPALGDLDDLRALATALREQGISLVLDLVLNHVAREHAWARAARAGDARYRDYFHVFADRTAPDAFERTLPEVFPDFAPGNFTWDADLDAYVWTTFNDFQWDVDWSNPEVLLEYVGIVLFLANLGVDVLRLDAIAFVWKRLGTNCQNQPEVHAVAQVLRTVLRIAAPAVLLKAEAIVAPGDLVHYLGQGRHHGKVSDLAYHNTLMVQVWSMLATRDVTLAAHTLRSLPREPSTAAWICYLRCHDDIGWAIDDGDAAAVGLSGFGHRSFLSDFYTGEHPGSFASGAVFQANPETGDRRVSGMTHGLTGLATATDPVAVTLAVDRFLLAHAIVFGWGGIPVIWMGDELAQPADDDWAEEPGHEGDNRWLHRPRFDLSRHVERHGAATVTGRVYAGLQHLARIRSRLPQLHAASPGFVQDVADPGVLPILRRHPEGDLLELFNVTDSWRPFPVHRVEALGLGDGVDALTGSAPHRGEDGNLWLPPYAALWLVADVVT